MKDDEFLDHTSENFDKRTCTKCGATVIAFKWEKTPVCLKCGEVRKNE